MRRKSSLKILSTCHSATLNNIILRPQILQIFYAIIFAIAIDVVDMNPV